MLDIDISKAPLGSLCVLSVDRGIEFVMVEDDQ